MKTLEVSLSLDGVVLSSSLSHDPRTLTECLQRRYDLLLVRLKPVLRGSAHPGPLLDESIPFELLEHREEDGDLILKYRRLDESPTT